MTASHFSIAAGRSIRKYGVLALVAAIPFGVSPALATSFTITGSSTTAQTLGSTAGQIGTVAAGGLLTVSGSTVAVTIKGNDETLTNLGTIKQTGTGRVVRDNTGVTGLVINNGSASNSSALMQAADADVIQMNVATASVTLNNYGTMTSLNASIGGAQVVDFNAITSGSNIVNNYSTGVIQARDADAVRPGVNGVINNWGVIKSTVTTDTGSDGIDVKANTGVGINNYASGSITGARHGVTGGTESSSTSFTTTVTNAGAITGSNGSGINLDGFNAKQTAVITNSGSIIGTGVTGDGDGIDVDGVANITNTGIIRSTNAYSSTTPAQSEGITIGGGTITNSGTVEGLVSSGNTNAVGRGITLAGVDTSGTPEAIYANSFITNQAGGIIRGQSDSAITVGGPASGFTVTINNNAGAQILGGGSANAAIQTGADNDTVTNAGVIDGSSSGKAVSLGGGNNSLAVQGGSASILGNIDGGAGGRNTMTIDPGAGNSFAYSGSISNFSTVEIKSGIVTFSGKSDYAGVTLLSGGNLQLAGVNLLSENSLLDLNGGALELLNAGNINAQTFSGLTLSGSATIDLNSSSLTFSSLGTIGDGLTLSLVDYLDTTSLGYAFRLLGDYSTNSDFLRLMGETTINGGSAFYAFDGTYTDVTASPVPVPGALLLFGSGLAGLVGLTRKKS